MSRTVSLARAILAVIWCILIAAGYGLAQLGVLTGEIAVPEAPLRAQLQWVYDGYIIVFVLLLFYALIRRVAQGTGTPGQQAPAESPPRAR